MPAVGFLTDGAGRRVFALVPVAQLDPARGGRGREAARLNAQEREALERLLVRPWECLDAGVEANPIRAAREAAGLTQAELAFALGISQPMLSRQERPFRRLRAATLQRALGTIQRIQENRRRPVISLESVLQTYGERLETSAARKPRDPVERRLLREIGDPVALGEDSRRIRFGGERRRPPRKGTP